MSEPYPSHAEIEAMRGGGLVPDLFVDGMHTERDRHDAALARFERLMTAPLPPGDAVTFEVVHDENDPHRP